VRKSELVRKLSALPEFPAPKPRWEQVATPVEAAAELLLEADGRGDLAGRTVADLGSGTGRLALGAAWLGAEQVVGWEVDPEAVELARRSVADWPVRFEVREMVAPGPPGETVVMNPPFGAQRAGADRPFWEAAFADGRSAVYAFALADSRKFIEGRAVARGVRIEDRRPIPWSLPATFAHHRRRKVELEVDRWVLRPGSSP
jgi:putative methylase